MDSGISYTFNEDAANITFSGIPSLFQISQLELWLEVNSDIILGKKSVIVDLSRAGYVSSQIIGIIIGVGKRLVDVGKLAPAIIGGSDLVRHLFEVTCTSRFVRFLGG